MTTRSSNRRWLRFGLRGLFLLVTIACVVVAWCGHNWQTVSRRQSMISSITDRGGSILELKMGVDPSGTVAPEPLSWIRQKFGDRHIDVIMLPNDCEFDEFKFVQSLFPEARVWRNLTLQPWREPKQPQDPFGTPTPTGFGNK